MAGQLVGDDPGGQCRTDEPVALARPEVVERPCPDHVLLVAEEGLEGDQVGGRLAGAVRGHRPERGVLGQREVVGGDNAVQVGAAHRDHTADAVAAGGRQEVQRALGVGPEGAHRVIPRPTHVGLAGQVVHHLGCSGCDLIVEVLGSQEVGAARRPIGGDHIITLGLQMGNQMAAHEACGTGDQCLHQSAIRERACRGASIGAS